MGSVSYMSMGLRLAVLLAAGAPLQLQALKTVFDYISKLLEVRQEYSASYFSFQTRFFMLDTLHMNGKQNRTTANRESYLFNPEYDKRPN